MRFFYNLENFWCSELYQWRELKIGKVSTLTVEKWIPCCAKKLQTSDVMHQTLPLQVTLHLFRMLGIRVQSIEMLSGTFRFKFSEPPQSAHYVDMAAGSTILRTNIEAEIPAALEAVPEKEWIREHNSQQVLNPVCMPGGWQGNVWLPSLPSDLLLWLHRFSYRETFLHVPDLYEWMEKVRGKERIPLQNRPIENQAGWNLPPVLE